MQITRMGRIWLQNIGLYMLNQQCTRGRANKGHQNIELLVSQTDDLTANKIERRGERAAARLKLVSGERLCRAHARGQQRRYG